LFISYEEKKIFLTQGQGATMSTLDAQSPGRVSLNAPMSKDVMNLPGFQYAKAAPSTAGQDGIRGNFEQTPFNQAFFSQANFQIVQNAIRKKVFDESGDIIDPVSTDDLFMIMRAIFLWYGRNLPDHIPEQIAELNERITAWSVPKILAELSMYKYYLKDIDTLPDPIKLPVNQSSAGTKSLPFKPFF
jgi:hypothetical protein